MSERMDGKPDSTATLQIFGSFRRREIECGDTDVPTI